MASTLERSASRTRNAGFAPASDNTDTIRRELLTRDFAVLLKTFSPEGLVRAVQARLGAHPA